MWQILGQKNYVAEAPWPSYEDSLTKADTITIAVQVMGKVRAKIEAPADLSKDKMEKLALENENVKRHIEGKTVKKIIVVPGKLVNIVAN
jgi:leucyl-tRNA synthetase